MGDPFVSEIRIMAFRFAPRGWAFCKDSGPYQPMSPMLTGLAGGSAPHDNMMPYSELNVCIALEGVFPEKQQ